MFSFFPIFSPLFLHSFFSLSNKYGPIYACICVRVNVMPLSIVRLYAYAFFFTTFIQTKSILFCKIQPHVHMRTFTKILRDFVQYIAFYISNTLTVVFVCVCIQEKSMFTHVAVYSDKYIQRTSAFIHPQLSSGAVCRAPNSFPFSIINRHICSAFHSMAFICLNILTFVTCTHLSPFFSD